MMSIYYTDHLADELMLPALELYTNALGDKLLPIFGNAGRATKVLTQNLSLDNCFAALSDLKLVGVLSFQTHSGSFLNPSPKSMFDEYGLLGGAFRLVGLQLLNYQPRKNEWYIDGIAVQEGKRGLGIGSGLLDLVERTARNNEITQLSLEVVDTNPRAKALYESLGFVETGRKSAWPFNRIYGFPFNSATLMVKALSGPNVSAQTIVSARDVSVKRGNELLED